MHEICPICTSLTTRRLLQLRDQPICTTLLPTYEAARRAPAADIGLRYCPTCDHIFNDLFDSQQTRYPTVHPYPEYTPELLRFLNGRFPLKNRQIIDVGAMAGDLLSELIAGGSRGIGFMPTNGVAETPNVTWIRQPFSQAYLNLSADLILCRQTPQHVWDVRHLLTNLHKLAFEWHAPVLLEVQNVHCQMETVDVWSLRYEQCHYFSPHSLWQVVKEARFTPTSQSRPHDGRLLSVLTMPLATPLHIPPNDMADPAPFAQAVRVKVAEWATTLGQMRQQQDRVVVWQATPRSVSFLNILPSRRVIQYVIDAQYAEQFVPRAGQMVKSIEFLQSYQPDVVIVMDERSREDFGRILPTLPKTPTIMVA